MKIRNKKPISRANKIFTDREEPRVAFWKKYDLFKKGYVAEEDSEYN